MLNVAALSLVMLAAGPSPAPPPILHLTCPHIKGPIVIDGKLDDAWKDVQPISDFRLWGNMGKPTYAVSVRLAYDDDNVYAYFNCEDADLFTLYQDRDAQLWESDVVELFFQPDPKNSIYYEFEVAPNGAIFDARFVNTGSGGFKRWAQWNCGIRAGIQLKGTMNEWHDLDKGYTVEIAIPLDTFKEVVGDSPLKGTTWKFAAARADFSVTLAKEERSATANVPAGNIHDKDGWFTLTFK